MSLAHQLLTITRSDSTLFKFLEQYLQRLEGPLASQVWGRFNQLVKDILAGSRDFKLHHFATLRLISGLVHSPIFHWKTNRCLGVLAEKIIQSAAIEDRKIKKEFQVWLWNIFLKLIYLDYPQDHFGKLLDSCVVYVGRSTDQGSWIRRTAKDTILSTGSGRESPAPRSGKWLRMWGLEKAKWPNTLIDSAIEKIDPISTSLPLETSRSLEVVGQVGLFLCPTTDGWISSDNFFCCYISPPELEKVADGEWQGH